MYYKDLSNYIYFKDIEFPNVKSIGWLDNKHSFQTGKVKDGLVEKLKLIYMTLNDFNAVTNVMRGIFRCPFCKSEIYFMYDGKRQLLGNAELWIPYEEDKFFVAPTMIIHYIENHDYCPPEEFQESVMNLDLSENFNGQEVYDKLVKEYLRNNPY